MVGDPSSLDAAAHPAATGDLSDTKPPPRLQPLQRDGWVDENPTASSASSKIAISEEKGEESLGSGHSSAVGFCSILWNEGNFWAEVCCKNNAVFLTFNLIVLLASAAAFSKAERQNEIDTYNAAMADYNKYMVALLSLNTTSVNTTAFTEVHNYATANLKPSDSENWTFWSSMYFAYTICSTIGFGNFAPQTQWGRALVALLVPPMVVGLGALIAGLGTAVSCKLKRVVYILTKDHCNEQQQAISVAMIAFFLGTAFCLFNTTGTYYGQDTEGGVNDGGAEPNAYTYLDCFYFSTATFTTIGFGDMTPKIRNFGDFLLFYIVVTIGLMLIANIFQSLSDCVEAFTAEGTRDSFAQRGKEKELELLSEQLQGAKSDP